MRFVVDYSVYKCRKPDFKNCITITNAYGFVKKILDKWCIR